MNLRVVARGFQPRVGGLEEAALQFAAIVAACVLAPGLVFAQELPTRDRKLASSAAAGTISGVVTKRPSGEAAAGAVIKILNEPFGAGPPGAQTQTATAGADGSFLLTDVEPGTYWLVANMQGYLPVEYRAAQPNRCRHVVRCA